MLTLFAIERCQCKTLQQLGSQRSIVDVRVSGRLAPNLTHGRHPCHDVFALMQRYGESTAFNYQSHTSNNNNDNNNKSHVKEMQHAISK
jgi:hypothetical protein